MRLLPLALHSSCTQVVTDVELSPTAEDITLSLLEWGAPVAQPTSGPVEVEERDTPTAESSAPCVYEHLREWRCLEPGRWGRLQKCIQRIHKLCEPSDGAMRRLRIRLPCRALSGEPVSFLGTPDSDSSSVWRQMQALLRSKGSVFLWVDALGSPSAAGLQRRSFADLCHDVGCALPPVLVLTRWDGLQATQEPADCARSRLQRLCASLLHREQGVTHVTVTKTEEVGMLLEALTPQQGATLQEHPRPRRLLRSVALGGKTLHCGSMLLTGGDDDGGDMETRDSIADHLRSLVLPARLRFRTGEAKCAPLLACASAAAAVRGGAAAMSEVRALWASLLPLLWGSSEPLPLARRLQCVVEATQRVVNILMEDDRPLVFWSGQEHFSDLRHKATRSFAERMDQYFAGFPKYFAGFIGVWHKGSVEELCWEDYTPPVGLDRSECAMCLLDSFFQDAEGPWVFDEILKRWYVKFLETSVGFDQNCLDELQRSTRHAVGRMMPFNFRLQARQVDAKQLVLHVLNRSDVQAHAKELVQAEFDRRMRCCLGRLAHIQDLSQRLSRLRQCMSDWFTRFADEQVGRDPWLQPPPEELRDALAA